MAQLSNLIVNGVTRLLSKLYVSDSVTAPNFIGKLTGTAAKLGRNGDADTPMTFNWSGKDGQPTWLWGGENGSDMYVYNPSNFSVKNAKAAGSADSATKLSSSAGSATQPVYFSDGKPVATTYTLGKSVPASAVFTDTNTWRGVQNNLTSDATDQSLSAAQGKVLKGLVDGKAPSGHTHDDRYYTESEINTKLGSHTHGVIKSLSVNGTTITCTKDDGTTSTITTQDTNTTYGTFKGATTSKAGSTGLVIAPVAGNANRYLRSDGTWAVPPDTNTTYGVFAKATADAAGSTGLVPAPAKGQQTYYLRGDGTWAVPANTWRGIQDNLTSTSTTDSLSANQGKVLKGLIDGKAASGHTHNYAGSSSAGGAATSANKVNNALTINLNGTSQGAWDGSSAKSISITAASVGATSVTISRW